LVDYTKSVPKITSLHEDGLAPNYLAQPINYDNLLDKATSLHGTVLAPNYFTESAIKYVAKATSLHGTGLDPNYFTESTENTGSFPVYNTGFMQNYFNISKAEPLYKILFNKDTHKSSNEKNNSDFENLIEFTSFDEFANELKNIAASNKELLNGIKDSNLVLANELKDAVKAMNDSVKNQTELTLSIKSLAEEFKKQKQLIYYFFKNNN